MPAHISMATSSEVGLSKQEILQKCLLRSVWNNSLKVLTYLIEQGADVKQLDGGAMRHPINDTMPLCDMLEILTANDWDINSRRPDSSGIPLLWSIARDHGLVRWCLDHGADVNPPDDTPPNQAKMRKPILESAAANGNIPTFELLRNRGAPLKYDYGVLPVAVMSANGLAPRNGDEPSIQCSWTWCDT